MSYYATMRSHVTPIPTPLIVRLGASVLIAIGVAGMGSGLSNTGKALCLLTCTALAMILIFSHPYRREMRAYIEKKNQAYKPRLAQLLPLFPVWLAFMIMPTVAPLGFGWLGAAAFLTFWWMWVIFPHIDGTRPLAYL